MNTEQLRRVRDGVGFFAALDQSGGSTPKALATYGVPESAYTDEASMFDLIHAMRTRLMVSPAFDGDKILGAILFEQTMDRDVAGLPAADYLWERKGIVPFVKVDQGLAAEADGVQLMKPLDKLDALLARAVAARVFGTKMRSVISAANPVGIAAVVAQQFEVGRRIADAGLVPIIEPETTITAPDRAASEALLKDALLAGLDAWPADRPVMFKVSIPAVDGFWSDLIAHPKVLRVVALSGGFSQADADARLVRNPGLIASFSRALEEGLTAQQTDAEFDGTLAASVAAIYAASAT